MKTILIYASKHGCTEEIANQIVQALKIEEFVNVDEQNPNILDYDRVIIGTPIYAGLFNKKIKKFCKANAEELNKKKVALFVSRGNPQESLDEIISQNLPEIENSIDIIGDLGGEFKMDKLNFFEKKIIAMVSKGKEMGFPCKNEESLKSFIDSIKKEG